MISVHSTTRDSSFDINIDVPKWLNKKEWEFAFNDTTLQENTLQKNPSGLKVEIHNLSNDAIISFGNEQFVNQLQKEIEYEHMLNY